jgi:hypothetical protein
MNQEVPSLWIEEVAGAAPTPQTVHLAISWNPAVDSKRVKDSGADHDELVTDFRNGFLIRKRRDGKNREGFDLITSRFCLRLGSIRAEQSGAPLARFFGCRLNEEGSAPDLLRGQVTFAPVWDEVECDLDQMAAAAAKADRERRKNESERDNAAAKLRKVPRSPPDPLAEAAHFELRGLVGLLNLFEKRHIEQPGQSLSAKVLPPDCIEPLANKATQEGSELRRLHLRLEAEESEFEPSQIVEFRSAITGDTWERGKVLTVEGGHLGIELFPRSSFPADESVEVRPYRKFDRKNHQIALERFLREDTKGHWPALVRLMASPRELPPPKAEPGSRWFNPKLNDEQQKAVMGAINAPFGFFIQGPPGTGNSTVISEIVQHLTARGERILLVAPTHVAVDSVLEKVGDAQNIFAVRLAREEEDVSPNLRRFHERMVSYDLGKSVRCHENTQSPAWRERLAQCRIDQEKLHELQRTMEARDVATHEQIKAQKERDQWETEAALALLAARDSLSITVEAVQRTNQAMIENTRRYEREIPSLRAAQARARALKRKAEKFTNGPLVDATGDHEQSAGVLAEAESALATVRDDLLGKEQALEDELRQEKEWQEKLERLDSAVKQAQENVENLSIVRTRHVGKAEKANQNHRQQQTQAGFWSNAGNWFSVGPLASARKASEQAESARKETENKLRAAQRNHRQAEKVMQEAEAEWRSWHAAAERDKTTLRGKIGRLAEKLQRCGTVCEEKRKIASQKAARLERLQSDGKKVGRAVSEFECGPLAGALNAFQEAKSNRQMAEREQKAAAKDWTLRREELEQLLKQQSAWRAKSDRKLAQKHEVVHRTEQDWANATSAVPDGTLLSDNDIRTRLDELAGREREFGKWLKLEEEWLEDTNATTRAEMGKQLLRSANLICATTVAIGGHPMIAGKKGNNGERVDGEWSDFDTLIVDEASRVTDAEFLIGAVLSRRWILVGDEHQLPPYVEQDEEHFLHALVALRMAEQGVALDVTTAIEKLENWWEEDEELRQFRRESVLRQVGELLGLEPQEEAASLEGRIESARHLNRYDAGRWRDIYRDSIEQIANSIEKRGEEERNRELMRLMIQFMVRSLFERCLEAIGPENPLCQKLVTQRRMLGSIAELVRDPIYAGNYASPTEEDLRQHGLSPFGFGKPFDGDVVFLDTSSQKSPWQRQSGNGFVNDLECDWILKTCRRLDDELVRRKEQKPVTATILCFYQAQVKQIRDQFQAEHHRKPFRLLNLFERERVRVVPIDRIQGQESDIVFISFVRTYGHNPPRGFGLWLQDYRRLNVACTRAHRMLVLVGHRITLEQMAKKSGFLKAQSFYGNLFGLLDGQKKDANPRCRLVKHL